jgi:hypothetical protein
MSIKLRISLLTSLVFVVVVVVVVALAACSSGENLFGKGSPEMITIIEEPNKVGKQMGDFILHVEINKHELERGEHLLYDTYIEYVGSKEIFIKHARPLVLSGILGFSRTDTRIGKRLIPGEKYNFDGMWEFKLEPGVHVIQVQSDFKTRILKYFVTEYFIPIEFTVTVLN